MNRLTKISKADLKNAAKICFRSALELLEDAKLLEAMHRYARSIFLACIGIEELGKATLSLELYQSDIELDAKEFLKFWRHHESKIAYASGFFPFNPTQMKEICPHLLPPQYKDWFEYEREKRDFYANYSRLTTEIKMGSLYADIRLSDTRKPNLKFSLPSRSFKKEHARNFIKELEAKIKELKPEIEKLGPLYLPPYDTGDIYDDEAL